MGVRGGFTPPLSTLLSGGGRIRAKVVSTGAVEPRRARTEGSCITHFQAHELSRTCDEGKEERRHKRCTGCPPPP